MSQPSPTSPALNRLRAAAGLIPLIEHGLLSARIDGSKAVSMAEFCESAIRSDMAGDPEADRLISHIQDGLARIRRTLPESAQLD